jgi:(R,R)-butanediol dehydrogenase/meso-butanediol dehydrogenase/diacetyl reductase
MNMKAAVIEKAGKISVVEQPRPKIEAGEVLVKVQYAGICGSDIHAYLNPARTPEGTVMGHECSGVVEKIGDGVEGFKPGERVAVKPLAPCRECSQCRQGRENACPVAIGRCIGINLDNGGAFSEFVRVRYPREMLFKLPREVPLEQGALVEPLAVSLHGVRKAKIGLGDRVVVMGAGMIGLGAMLFAKLSGAGQIIVLEISPERSQIAQQLGADSLLNPKSEGIGLKDKIFEVTNGHGVDVVFECSGAATAFQNAVPCLKQGGRVVVLGLADGDVPINSYAMVVLEAEIVGSVGYRTDEFNDVIALLKQKKIETRPLISSVITLDEIDAKGFQRLISSPEEIKIMVKP